MNDVNEILGRLKNLNNEVPENELFEIADKLELMAKDLSKIPVDRRDLFLDISQLASIAFRNKKYRVYILLILLDMVNNYLDM